MLQYSFFLPSLLEKNPVVGYLKKCTKYMQIYAYTKGLSTNRSHLGFHLGFTTRSQEVGESCDGVSMGNLHLYF